MEKLKNISLITQEFPKPTTFYSYCVELYGRKNVYSVYDLEEDEKEKLILRYLQYGEEDIYDYLADVYPSENIMTSNCPIFSCDQNFLQKVWQEMIEFYSEKAYAVCQDIFFQISYEEE